MRYIETIADQCLRRVMRDDTETVTEKSRYIAETIEAVVRSEVLGEVEEAFDNIRANLEVDLVSARTRDEEAAIQATIEALVTFQRIVLDRMR